MSDTLRRNAPQYRSPTTPLHAWHDGTASEPISATIVAVVAKFAGVDVTQLPPLYDWIDPDALNKLLQPKPDLTKTFNGHVTFRYAEHLVTVFDDGEIMVRKYSDGWIEDC